MCFCGLFCRILENSPRNGKIRLRNYIVYVGTPQTCLASATNLRFAPLVV